MDTRSDARGAKITSWLCILENEKKKNFKM